jgi:hypothetical protein
MIYDSGVKKDAVHLAFKLYQRIFVKGDLTVALSDTLQSGQTDTRSLGSKFHQICPVAYS